jgi:hypothetical protein
MSAPCLVGQKGSMTGRHFGRAFEEGHFDRDYDYLGLSVGRALRWVPD